MHLKVMRSFIDGVLRFGIPANFLIGVVQPKKGYEKQVLPEMTKALITDQEQQEFYGEKLDANDTEDYWPFVSIPLGQPNFMHKGLDN